MEMNPVPLKTKGEIRIPKTLWYQADDRVVLRIMLPGVKEYFLNVDLDHLQFSTIYDGKPYYLCLYFFGAVIPEKTIHENLGREIKILIPKAHRFAKWQRLQYHSNNHAQITMDPDRIEETAWKPKKSSYRPWRNIEEYRRMHGNVQIRHDVESDHDDSDDERFFMLCDEY